MIPTAFRSSEAQAPFVPMQCEACWVMTDIAHGFDLRTGLCGACREEMRAKTPKVGILRQMWRILVGPKE
jgi:hypothetical protein